MATDATAKLAWFRKARFGLFIHWGLYAIPARGEWVRSNERLSVSDYEPYFRGFRPTAADLREWARLARRAGQRYAVLTAKHHDGFCLFDSKLTNYKSTNTPAGRDFVAEFVEAFRAEGLKVGLYYSLPDWYHPDYPAYGDLVHPMRDDKRFRDMKHNFSAYLDYMHEQVKELLTQYGTIDLMWFDFSYDQYRGEAWRAAELVAMIRTLQPHILLNNRLGANMSDGVSRLSEYAGDFMTPERVLPLAAPVDDDGHPIPWEACLTLNDNWGYCASDANVKPASAIIRALAECVSKDGNLLLNVGPDATGRIPVASAQVLEKVGRWLDRNGDSIYGCGVAPLEKPDWGRYTMKGDKVYAHIFERSVGPVRLAGLNRSIGAARLLADGSEALRHDSVFVKHYPDDLFLDFPAATLPDPCDTVVELAWKDALVAHCNFPV